MVRARRDFLMRPRDLIALRAAVSFDGPLDNANFANAIHWYDIVHPGTATAPANAPCMDVRRDSDDLIATFGFIDDGAGGAILDYAGIEAHCGTGSGFVSKRYDNVGVADLIQTGTTLQPLICSFGKAIEAPLYDGVDDDMEANNASVPANNYSYLIWSTYDNPSGRDAAMCLNDSDDFSSFRLEMSQGVITERHSLAILGGVFSFSNAATLVPDLDWKALQGSVEGTTFRAYMNGGGKDTDTVVSWVPRTMDTIIQGNNRTGNIHNEAWEGMISRMGIFSVTKSDAEQTGMHAAGRPNASTTLLLDQAHGANAVAALSLRKERDLYGGRIGNFRRTDDDALIDLFPNPLDGSWQSAALENFVTGTGFAAIVTLNDQVGTHDHTNAVTTEQPAVVENDVAAASMLIDGSNRHLASATTPITAVPLTCHASFVKDVDGSNDGIASIGDSGAVLQRFLMIAFMGNAGDPLAAGTSASSQGFGNSTTGITAGTSHTGTAVFNGIASRSGFIDGGSKGTDTTSLTPTSLDKMTIGTLVNGASNGNFLVGRVASVFWFDVAKSDADVALLDANTLVA